MSEIYLIRHGQASFGTDDYDRLSELGTRQARWLGEYFAERDLQFDRVVIGTQLRHRQTADAILSACPGSLNCETHPGLNEYDFDPLLAAWLAQQPDDGDRCHSDKTYFFRVLKQALHAWARDALPGDLPETWREFCERVDAARLHIQQSSPDKARVLVVSSGGPIAVWTRLVLAMPELKMIDLNLQLRNASFSHFYFNRQQMHLASFNNVNHLDQPNRLDAITYG